MNKKNLFYWSLYDFANSFVMINFLLYFSQWLVIEGGLSDFWYNALFAISSIILLLTAPTLATFTDKHGGRKYFLKLSTFGILIGYGFATLLAYLNQSEIIIALFFLLGQYFYQLAFSFYNPMIEDVADMAHRSRASGIGQFSNSAGQIAGLILAIPLSQTRLQPLFPSIIVFFLLSLPMLMFFKEQRTKQISLTLKEFKDESKYLYKKFILFVSASVAIPILLSVFFFNDALLTVSNNYSIYLERVFGMPGNTKNIILMIVLLMSAFGGLIFGKIGDKISTSKSLKYILIGWIILLPILSSVKNIIPLIICSALLGFFMGGILTVVRAYLSQILKKEELGYGFTFYTIFERFATFLGPLSWGGIIAVMGTGEHSYRFAMLSMTSYIIIGLLVILLWKRRADKNI